MELYECKRSLIVVSQARWQVLDCAGELLGDGPGGLDDARAWIAERLGQEDWPEYERLTLH